MNSNVTLSVELVDVSKMKLDHRHQSPKRRTSKTGHCLDKDENAPQFNREEHNNSDLKPLDSLENIDRRSNTWEPKLSKEESNDIRHLKELLMLNLDLIKQQQDLLHLKDGQLAQCKQENQNLRCRLERMERRMSLLKGGITGEDRIRQSLDTSSTTTPLHETTNRAVKRRSAPGPSPSLAKKFAHMRNRQSETGTYFIRKAQRKSHLNRLTLTRRKTLSGGTGRSIGTSRQHHYQHNIENEARTTPRRELRTRTDSSHTPSSHQSTTTADVPVSSSPRPRRDLLPARATPSQTDKETIQAKGKVSSTRSPSKRDAARVRVVSAPKDSDILKTDTCYYVPVTYNLDPVIEPKSEKTEEVLVPTFRIKKFCPYYVIEGTENFDDEVYLKRHQKHEAEERKRKRWDLQRQRELEQLEKLTRKGNGENGVVDAADDDDTFVPDPDQIKFIEVCDKLPVCVYGASVPKLTNSSFDLPWFDIERREKSEQKKKSRKR